MKAPLPRMLPSGATVSPPRAIQPSVKAVPTPGAPGFPSVKIPKVSNTGIASTSGDDETKRIGDKLLARLAKNDMRPPKYR